MPPQDLLKHTPEDHPDHPLLLDAQRNIKQVAERINKGVRSAEEAERHARVLQEIEAHIEGMEDVRAAPPPRPCLCPSVVTWHMAVFPSTAVSALPLPHLPLAMCLWPDSVRRGNGCCFHWSGPRGLGMG